MVLMNGITDRHKYNFTRTRNSAIADKLYDAFVQYVIPFLICLTKPNLVQMWV